MLKTQFILCETVNLTLHLQMYMKYHTSVFSLNWVKYDSEVSLCPGGKLISVMGSPFFLWGHIKIWVHPPPWTQTGGFTNPQYITVTNTFPKPEAAPGNPTLLRHSYGTLPLQCSESCLLHAPSSPLLRFGHCPGERNGAGCESGFIIGPKVLLRL